MWHTLCNAPSCATCKDILATWECWDPQTHTFTCDATHDADELSHRPPTRHNIRVLHVFEFLSPFAGMKYGNCGGYDRIESIDCVHYCGNAFPMWMPVWAEMDRLIAHHVRGYDHRVEVNGPAVGNITASEGWINRLPTVHGYVPQTDIQIVQSIETNQLYFVFHGVKRPVPDLLSLADELWNVNSDTIDPADPINSFEVSGVRVVRLACDL